MSTRSTGLAEGDRLFDAYIAALSVADRTSLSQLLAPDCVWISKWQSVRGRDSVVEFLCSPSLATTESQPAMQRVYKWVDTRLVSGCASIGTDCRAVTSFWLSTQAGQITRISLSAFFEVACGNLLLDPICDLPPVSLLREFGGLGFDAHQCKPGDYSLFLTLDSLEFNLDGDRFTNPALSLCRWLEALTTQVDECSANMYLANGGRQRIEGQTFQGRAVHMVVPPRPGVEHRSASAVLPLHDLVSAIYPKLAALELTDWGRPGEILSCKSDRLETYLAKNHAR